MPNKLKYNTLKTVASLLVAFTLLSTVFSATANLSDLQQQQQTTQQRRDNIRAELEEARRMGLELIAEMLEIEMQLEDVREAHQLAYYQLQETKALLAHITVEHAAAEIRREAQYEAYRESLRFIYMRGNIGYIEILFTSRSFNDLVRNVEYINRIISHDNQILDDLIETERVIYESLIAIRILEVEQILLEEELASQYETLQAILAIKEAQYYSIRQDEARNEQLLQELEQENTRIANLIREAEAELARQEAARRAAAAATPAPTNIQAANAQMLWPVPGHSWVSSDYGWRPNPFGGASQYHRGIDIPAPTGTGIVAAESGTVIFSGWMSGFGNTIIISHAGGLSTLYAHNSRNIATVGQQVRRGDRIALVGSTGLSTGPHLHFEVRRNGNSINPNPFLGR